MSMHFEQSRCIFYVVESEVRKIEIFNIVGRISAQYSEAVESIQSVSTAADNAAENIGGLGEEAENTQESVEGLGDETEETGEQTDDTNESFTIWKGTLANIASQVITTVISKVKDLAKEIVGLGEDFTATMSEVKAISGASDEEFAKLEETARKFGSETVFSATEAAEALKYMSLAGWDTEQSTAALGGVLDLAAASGMELGQASDMVTDYLSAFGMGAEDAAYFADLLAYAQANSNTTAAQLGDAYGNCAASLNAAGQDIETVTALLESMANQGLKGSEGGTALSATMRDITNSMSEVKDETDLAQLAQSEFVSSTGDLNDLLGKNYIQMGKTLIPVSDAQGNFRDLTDILTDVSDATNGMGDAERAAAMANTFTAYSIKGVNLVINEGMDKVAGYEEELRKANGAASDMADTMNDNLKGDLAGMNSALDELKLKFFDGLEGPLRSAAQFITNKVVPALTALLQNFDSILPGVVALTTAITTFKTVMAISSLINTVTAAWTAYKTANEGATVAQWLFNAAVGANPLVLLISLLVGLVVMFVVLWNKCDWFREFWINAWEKIKEVASSVWEAITGFFSNAWEKIKEIWGAVTGFFSGLWENLKSIFSKIANWVNDNVVQPIKDFFTPFVEFFSALFEVIRQLTVGVIETIKIIVGTIASWVDENVIQPVKNFFIDLWDSVSAKVSEMWETIKSIFLPVFGWINEHMIQPVAEVFSSLWNGISNKASEAWDGIKSVFSKVAEFFGDIFSKAWEKVKNVFSVGGKIFEGMKEGIVENFKKVVNVIIRGVNKAITFPFDHINGLLDRIQGFDILGQYPFEGLTARITVPQIPELAEGGILPKGKTGYLEGDGAEAIVPLERNTEWTGRVADLIVAHQQNTPQIDMAVLDKLTEIANLLKSQKQSDSGINLTINVENLKGDKSDVDWLVKEVMAKLYPEIYRRKVIN